MNKHTWNRKTSALSEGPKGASMEYTGHNHCTIRMLHRTPNIQLAQGRSSLSFFPARQAFWLLICCNLLFCQFTGVFFGVFLFAGIKVTLKPKEFFTYKSKNIKPQILTTATCKKCKFKTCHKKSHKHFNRKVKLCMVSKNKPEEVTNW